MRSFLVKHNAKKRGPLVERLPVYSSCPQSFTSKRAAAKSAVGNEVFVIETRPVSGKTRYFVGYKYVVRKCEEHPAPGRWHDQFTHKNEAAASPNAEGTYFLEPVLVTDPLLHEWLLSQRLGMAEVPAPMALLLSKVSAPPEQARRGAPNPSIERTR